MLLYSYNYWVFTSDDESVGWSENWRIVMGELPPTLYILAVIINLSNWTNYYFVVKGMAFQAHPHLMRKNSNQFKNKKRIIVLLSIFAFTIVVALTIWTYFISGSSFKIKRVITFWKNGSLFILFGILFLISSTMINLKIKTHFTEFYKANRIVLWLVCFFLSVP